MTSRIALPGRPASYWLETTEELAAQVPTRHYLPTEQPDVLVIGAGIAGITTAALLQEQGKRVVLLEAELEPCAGVTGLTTAKLTAAQGLLASHLAKSFDHETAQAYVRAQTRAVEWVAERAAQHPCDFERTDNYVYSLDIDERADLELEAALLRVCGLDATVTDDISLPFETAGAVVTRDQAAFHPRAFLLSLLLEATQRGLVLATGIRARSVDESGDLVTVTTTAGDISARDVVVTTHMPVFDRSLFFARMSPTRDTVLTAVLDSDDAPEGMFISTEEDSHSIRTVPWEDGRRLVLMGGAHFETGREADSAARVEELATWCQEQMGVSSFEHRWAAQDYTTVDRLPYIGRYHSGARHLWTASGFGAWGMSNGVLSGLLLSDLVLHGEAAGAELFDPARVHLKQGARRAVSLNATVAKHLVRDRLTHLRSVADPAALQAGEASIGLHEGRMTAAYRDDEGCLHAVSGNCTHMGCVLAFNTAEHSWDCPCHGSRFSVDGDVLDGPATKPLEQLQVGEVEEVGQRVGD